MSVAEETDLNPTLSESPMTGFVELLPKCNLLRVEITVNLTEVDESKEFQTLSH